MLLIKCVGLQETFLELPWNFNCLRTAVLELTL